MAAQSGAVTSSAVAPRALIAIADRALAEALVHGLQTEGWQAELACAWPALEVAEADRLCLLDARWTLAQDSLPPARRRLHLCIPNELQRLLAHGVPPSDAYALRPSTATLLMRQLEALHRGALGNLAGCRWFGPLLLDIADGGSYWHGVPVALTGREFELLQMLVEAQGEVVERELIEQRIYRWGQELGSNAIDVHVHALRRKFGPDLIETVRGCGFRLCDAGPPT